jgi:hypothetical protein
MPLDLPDLLELSKDELDELFRQSPAGEIPQGDADGIVLVAPGTEVSWLASKTIHLVAWRGKFFRPEKGDLKNKILPFGLQAVRAKVYKQASWFDGKETIVLDYSKTSLLARKVRDEIREVSPGVYLGLVFWGRDKIALFALKFAQAG